MLALTFSIQDLKYLYDTNNETAGTFVPAQILYDAFHGRYHGSSKCCMVMCGFMHTVRPSYLGSKRVIHNYRFSQYHGWVGAYVVPVFDRISCTIVFMHG